VRTKIGYGLLGLGAILKTGFMLLLFIAVFIGTWIQIGGLIWESPWRAIYLIPVGFIVIGFLYWLSQFLYDLLIGMPLALICSLLLKDEIA